MVQIFPKNMNHQAYWLLGDSSLCQKLISEIEGLYKIDRNNNPDFIFREYQNIGIDDAKEIKKLHDTVPVSVPYKKIFILSFDNITIEAQNALLKLLEEPNDYAYFFLVVRSKDILIPTIKSRLHYLNTGDIENIYKKDAESFIFSNINKRLDYIKKLVDDISKEKKTKKDAIDFVVAIETILASDNKIKNKIALYDTINMAKKYLNDRAPSVKMLLESIALSI
jgi:DNA polymerase III delta prime subunit